MHRHKWLRRLGWLTGVVVALAIIGACSQIATPNQPVVHHSQPVAVASHTATPSPAYSGPDYTYKHAKVTEDNEGYGLDTFAGHIRVVNHTDQLADVTVTVNVFRHSQNLGELDGYTTVKPHSSTRVKLTSLDNWNPNWTDAHVQVDGFPAN